MPTEALAVTGHDPTLPLERISARVQGDDDTVRASRSQIVTLKQNQTDGFTFQPAAHDGGAPSQR